MVNSEQLSSERRKNYRFKGSNLRLKLDDKRVEIFDISIIAVRTSIPDNMKYVYGFIGKADLIMDKKRYQFKHHVLEVKEEYLVTRLLINKEFKMLLFNFLKSQED